MSARRARVALLGLLVGCSLSGTRYIGSDFAELAQDGGPDGAARSDGGPLDGGAFGPGLLPPGAPTEHLYLYWTLDDDALDVARDVSGEGRHGVLTNAPSLSEPSPSVRASNLRGRFFNGTGERASYALEAPLTRFSLALWMKPATTDAAFVFAYSDGFGTALVELGVGPGGRVEVRADGAPPMGACAEESACVRAEAPVLRDQWVHVAFVAEAGGALRLFLDGIEQGATTLPAFVTAGARFEFASSEALIRPGLRGVLDDILVYDVALAPQDVAALAAR